MRSILSLHPALQAVWTAVYNHVLTERSRLSGQYAIGELSRESAAVEAWEAVRRANGGAMPEEQEREEWKCAVVAARPQEEPTDEEMVEALALIVAEQSHGAIAWMHNPPFHETWIEYARQCLAGIENTWSVEFRQHCAIALASWKAARAWGRK